MPRVTWTNGNKNKLWGYVKQEGMTVAIISKEFDTTPKEISLKLAELGWKVKNTSWTEGKQAMTEKLYVENKTMSEIAKIIGCAVSTVTKRLQYFRRAKKMEHLGKPMNGADVVEIMETSAGKTARHGLFPRCRWNERFGYYELDGKKVLLGQVITAHRELKDGK